MGGRRIIRKEYDCQVFFRPRAANVEQATGAIESRFFAIPEIGFVSV